MMATKVDSPWVLVESMPFLIVGAVINGRSPAAA